MPRYQRIDEDVTLQRVTLHAEQFWGSHTLVKPEQVLLIYAFDSDVGLSKKLCSHCALRQHTDTVLVLGICKYPNISTCPCFNSDIAASACPKVSCVLQPFLFYFIFLTFAL